MKIKVFKGATSQVLNAVPIIVIRFLGSKQVHFEISVCPEALMNQKRLPEQLCIANCKEDSKLNNTNAMHFIYCCLRLWNQKAAASTEEVQCSAMIAIKH